MLRKPFIQLILKYFGYLKIALVLGLIFYQLDRPDLVEAAGRFHGRKTAYIHGDILIGALVAVHRPPEQREASALICGEIWEQYGIQRIEATFHAIDQINKDQILPNITLGIEIRDSCWNPSIALEQSIEFIRDAITGPEQSVNNGSVPRCASPQGSSAPPSNKNLVGVIGPGSSAVTIQVQNLLQLFRIPQIGYSATSKDLSDKSRFSYFMRVVPSDYYQAQVMVDIVKHYNWTYVSVVHTDENYGHSGMAAFREVAESNDVCIAKEDTVLSNAEDAAFEEVILRLSEDSRANVVVCFCEGMTIRNLLKATKRLGKFRRFQFLGSDGWADRPDVVEDIEDAALGGLSIKIHSQYVDSFDSHYFSLRPETNLRNPWFREFWQQKFNCRFKKDLNSDFDEKLPFINRTNEKSEVKYCTGTEDLREEYKQDTKMGFVVKATYAMAYGLQAMHKDLCHGEAGLCERMFPINGLLLRDYLMNVSFNFMNETVAFDSRGDPPGRYDIMNFQKLPSGRFDYVKVGSWDNGTLIVNSEGVVFNGSSPEPPQSVCSMPCGTGQFKSFIDTGDDVQVCCWVCNDCQEDEYLLNETTCASCGKEYWPNLNKTNCEPIPIDFVWWGSDEAIAAFVVAGVGFLATLFVMGVFICFNDTPVVKASTRELSYIIFVGMMISYLSCLPLLHKPTQFTCALARVMPGFSFSMIYAALLTKTNRIARIMAGNKKIMTRKLRFMSATAQVMITCSLISIEVAIIFFMILHQRPAVVHSYPTTAKVVLICNTTPLGIMAPLGFDFFLVIMCTVYAVKTRNLPENFNEAKFIGFSMYTTCVIWLAWFAIYFGSDHKVTSLSLCTSLSALVTLVLLFFPKVYIILCRPEKNNRSAFTTTTELRCHIGSSHHQRKKIPCQNMGSIPLTHTPSIGNSSMGTPYQSRWSNLILQVRGSLRGSASLESSKEITIRPDGRKQNVRREPSNWSEGSTSTTALIDQKSVILQKSFNTQGNAEKRRESSNCSEEKCVQTCDELLDPLIPRLRRRVTQAVRDGRLSKNEGEEFFDLTRGVITSNKDSKIFAEEWM